MTIAGGLFCGLSRSTAAGFSFLLSLPSVLAAAVLELVDQREALLASSADATNLIVATIVAGVVGYATIAFLMRYLRIRSMWLFIWYRLALGALLLGLLAAGKIQDKDEVQKTKEEKRIVSALIRPSTSVFPVSFVLRENRV